METNYMKIDGIKDAKVFVSNYFADYSFGGNSSADGFAKWIAANCNQIDLNNYDDELALYLISEDEPLEDLGPEYDVDVTVCEMPDVNGVVRTVYTCSGFLGNIQALERAIKGRYERFGGNQRMFVEVDE